MSRLSWSQAVVKELKESKAAGVGFESAWAFALELHPPSSPAIEANQITLLDQPEETFEEFHKRSCWMAWNELGPGLDRSLVDSNGHFTPVKKASKSTPG